jgi:hypothetical protein
MDPLRDASNPLGDAQADLTTAIRALPPPT